MSRSDSAYCWLSKFYYSENRASPHPCMPEERMNDKANMSLEPVKVPWRPVEPLEGTESLENGSVGALDGVRKEWNRRLSAFTEAERVRIRQRSLRKLSIETGILERLYEVDWGLTLTLVAEGFTKDVVERVGGQVDERTL